MTTPQNPPPAGSTAPSAVNFKLPKWVAAVLIVLVVLQGATTVALAAILFPAFGSAITGQQVLVGDVNQDDLADADIAGVFTPDERAELRAQIEEELLADLREDFPEIDARLDEDVVEPPVLTPEIEEGIIDWFEPMGIEPVDLLFDDFLDDPAERGDTSFSPGVLDTWEELVTFINADTPEAKALRAVVRDCPEVKDFERWLSGAGFFPVQVTIPVTIEGNTFFRNADGAAVFSTTPREVAAGDIIWVYVNPEGEVVECGSVRADCGNVRVERIVPQEEPAPAPEQAAPQPAKEQDKPAPKPAPEPAEERKEHKPVKPVVHQPEPKKPEQDVPPQEPPAPPAPPEQPPAPPEQPPAPPEQPPGPPKQPPPPQEPPPDQPPPPDNPPPPEEPPPDEPPPNEPPPDVPPCVENPDAPKCQEEPPPPDNPEPCPSNPELPKDSPECEEDQVPPPPEPPVDVCPEIPGDQPEGTNCEPTPPTDVCPNLPGNQPEGYECNPPPPEEPVKCADLPEGSDGYCGTPNEGGEQQPVQDNNPDHTDPTPGYDDPNREDTDSPGPAEENSQEQDEARDAIDNGDADAHDPTESGVEVPDSQEGGEAPGGEVTTPEEQPSNDDNSNGDGGSDSGSDQNDEPQPNPDHDGSEETQNPDEGTSDPVDTPASDNDENQGSDNSDSDDNNDGDPLADMDLP